MQLRSRGSSFSPRHTLGSGEVTLWRWRNRHDVFDFTLLLL